MTADYAAHVAFLERVVLALELTVLFGVLVIVAVIVSEIRARVLKAHKGSRAKNPGGGPC